MHTSMSVVIPCHNEQDAIPVVLKKIAAVRKVFPAIHEVIVVDDGSTDNSLKILKTFEDITVISSEKCMGYGASLKKGFMYASSDLIAFLDMDDTYDVWQLPILFKHQQENDLDVLFGNRLQQKSGMPFVRAFGNNLYFYLLKALRFPHLADPCTGMRVFKSHLQGSFCAVNEDDLSYSMSLTLHILTSDLKFAEIKIPYHERIGESKLIPLYDGALFFWAILRHRFLA